MFSEGGRKNFADASAYCKSIDKYLPEISSNKSNWKLISTSIIKDEHDNYDLIFQFPSGTRWTWTTDLGSERLYFWRAMKSRTKYFDKYDYICILEL